MESLKVEKVNVAQVNAKQPVTNPDKTKESANAQTKVFKTDLRDNPAEPDISPKVAEEKAIEDIENSAQIPSENEVEKSELKKWLNDKDKVCTDDKDDGKISWKEKIKSFGKGLFGIVKSVIKHPIATGATLAVAGAAVALAGTAALPVLVAVGAVIGGAQFIYGGYKAITAKTDGEAKAAWENMGEGTFALVTSALSAGSALKAAKTATDTLKAVGIEASLGVAAATKNPIKNLVSCIKIAPKATKISAQTTKVNANAVANKVRILPNLKYDKNFHQLAAKIKNMPDTLGPEEKAKTIIGYCLEYYGYDKDLMINKKFLNIVFDSKPIKGKAYAMFSTDSVTVVLPDLSEIASMDKAILARSIFHELTHMRNLGIYLKAGGKKITPARSKTPDELIQSTVRLRHLKKATTSKNPRLKLKLRKETDSKFDNFEAAKLSRNMLNKIKILKEWISEYKYFNATDEQTAHNAGCSLQDILSGKFSSYNAWQTRLQDSRKQMDVIKFLCKKYGISEEGLENDIWKLANFKVYFERDSRDFMSKLIRCAKKHPELEPLLAAKDDAYKFYLLFDEKFRAKIDKFLTD